MKAERDSAFLISATKSIQIDMFIAKFLFSFH